MNTEKFKYDVAFSFCQEDEPLVQIINEKLGDRLNTFYYPRKQNELVGFDGEEKFNEVFYKLSRLVVVFYRKKYGSTSWTRVEETAIKNRALNEGYDFTIYIPLEKDKSAPKYLPKARIWYDFNRFGHDALCAIIEKRVTDLDGSIKSESSEFKAKRLKRKIDYEKRLKEYFSSYDKEYISDARKEYDCLKTILKEKLNNLAEIFADNIRQEESDKAYVFRYRYFQIELIWKYSPYDTDDIPKILISLVKFHDSPDSFGNPGFTIVKKVFFKFHKDILWENTWLEVDKKPDKTTKSEILAEDFSSDFIEFINDPDRYDDNTNYWGINAL